MNRRFNIPLIIYRTLLAAITMVIALAAQPAMAQFPLQFGDIVMTCQGKCPNGVPDPNDFVIGTFDVQNWNQPANINSNSWSPTVYHHPTWTRAHLGDIFGACIDNSGNIYVTATVNYAICDYMGPAGPGAVYKINGVTGTISTFATLPQTVSASGSGVPINTSGLGNIAYDRANNQFFVTNFEDGKIYRLNNLGATVQTFDPFAADGGSTGPAPLGERLWGIGVHNNRVYFARWNEDRTNNSNAVNNEIWSVALSAGAISGAATLEITIPDLPCPSGQSYSSPVSDIAFSSGGRMLLAERGNRNHTFVDNHWARVLEYYPIAGWTLAPPYPTFSLKFNPSIFVFCPTVYSNSTGGIDYGYERATADGRPEQCDSVVWGTMDQGSGHLFGTPASGGANVNSVRLNMGTDKNQVGDVETYRPLCGVQVIDSCKEKSFKTEKVSRVGKLCCIDFSLTNNVANFFTHVTATVITPSVLLSSALAPAGWGVNSAGNSATFTPSAGYVPVGTATGFKICVFAMAPPPQEIVLTWYGKNGSVCRDTIRMDCPQQQPPIPKCDSLTNVSIICKQISPNGGGNVYQMTFSVVNLNPFNLPAENIDLGIIPAGLSVSPTSFNFAPVPFGGTAGPFTVTISGPGAVSGTNFCLLVKLLGHRDPQDSCCFSWCCPQDTFCFTLPPCENCCEGFSSRFSALPAPGAPLLTYNAAGVVTLNTSVTAAPGPMIAMSVSIVSATLSQQCANRNPRGNVFGTITNGTAGFGGLSGPTFSSPPIPSGGSHEIQWGINPTGVTITNTPLTLTMGFPPPPSFFPKPFNCHDTLRFCLRYRFTDKRCRTCDTIVCYQLVRRPVLVINPNPDHVGHFIKGGNIAEGNHVDVQGADEKRDEPTILGAADEETGPLQARITMSSSTEGKLKLDFASVNPDDPATIVGLKMEPSTGVNIASMKDDVSGTNAVVRDHVASITTSIAEGTSRTFSVTYENPLNQKTFINWLLVRFVMKSNPSDTLSGELAIMARTPAGSGGDTLIRDITTGEERKDVRTYALRFTSGNPTGDSIARVVIKVKGNARILAVGPGTDSTSVTLTAYASDSSGARWLLTVPVDPQFESAIDTGRTLGPIYVTVAGAEADGAMFEYETQTANGDIVSTGSIKVKAFTTGIRMNGDDLEGAATISLADCRPNPLTGFTTITFNLATAEQSVWLVVSDANGREVMTPITGSHLEAGEHRVDLDASGLPSGTYYYTLRTQNATQTRKMVVVR